MDALIELVAKLKSEKELYKMQVKRLLQSIRNTRKKTSNGLSPTLVAEDPAMYNSNTLLDYSNTTSEAVTPVGDDGTLMEPKMDLDDAQLYRSLVPGQRNSRASTMTTFVSSTPEDLSLNDVAETDCCDLSPTQDISGPMVGPNSCQACRMGGMNGVSKYAMTVIRRKLAHNHLLNKDLSPETEDFPRIIHSHEHTCNNNKLVTRNFIPTVYGDVCDTNVDGQTRELVDLSPTIPATQEKTIQEGTGNSGKTSSLQASDKLNFIMYI